MVLDPRPTGKTQRTNSPPGLSHEEKMGLDAGLAAVCSSNLLEERNGSERSTKVEVTEIVS